LRERGSDPDCGKHTKRDRLGDRRWWKLNVTGEGQVERAKEK